MEDSPTRCASSWRDGKRAPTPREKMLLIDRLIHLWHWQFSDKRGATRPASPTFIEGSRKEVIKFLDELIASISHAIDTLSY